MSMSMSNNHFFEVTPQELLIITPSSSKSTPALGLSMEVHRLVTLCITSTEWSVVLAYNLNEWQISDYVMWGYSLGPRFTFDGSTVRIQIRKANTDDIFININTYRVIQL